MSKNTKALVKELTRQQLEERRTSYRKKQRDLEERANTGTLLAPTLATRIARLNPLERHEVKQLINSMKLRKIIRRTLAEAYWLGQPLPPQPDLQHSTSMERLRRTVQAHESLVNYERALTSSDVPTQTYEPVITNSNQPQLIEVPHV